MPSDLISGIDLFNAATTIVGVLMGFVLKSFWGRLTTQQKELADFRVEVARDYTPRSESHRQQDEVIDRLRDIQSHMGRIEDRLNEKADKT